MNMPNRDRKFSDNDLVELTRSVEAHDFDRIAPPAQVWNNVLAELEVEVASNEADARRQAKPWYQSSRLLSAAAAALLMVGVAAAVVAYRGGEQPVNEVAAAAMSNDGLPVETQALAEAIFACDDDGCFVDIDLNALPDAGADQLELWVINSDVTDMHSLGLITEADGRFELPDGVTADDFPIVDISVEPDDGDATHSGLSVLRGVFEQS